MTTGNCGGDWNLVSVSCHLDAVGKWVLCYRAAHTCGPRLRDMDGGLVGAGRSAESLVCVRQGGAWHPAPTFRV